MRPSPVLFDERQSGIVGVGSKWMHGNVEMRKQWKRSDGLMQFVDGCCIPYAPIRSAAGNTPQAPQHTSVRKLARTFGFLAQEVECLISCAGLTHHFHIDQKIHFATSSADSFSNPHYSCGAKA